jgi:hypothetical protein
VYKISRSWVDVLILISFYFESCIWPDAISPWIRQSNRIKLVMNKNNHHSQYICDFYYEINTTCFEWWLFLFITNILRNRMHSQKLFISFNQQNQMLCKSRKYCDGDPGNDSTSVRGRKHEPYTESPNSQRPKKARHVNSKVKSMLIIFFGIKRNIRKEFVLAGQTVNSTYYYDVLRRLRENVQRLVPNFGDKRIGSCITTT